MSGTVPEADRRFLGRRVQNEAALISAWMCGLCLAGHSVRAAAGHALPKNGRLERDIELDHLHRTLLWPRKTQSCGLDLDQCVGSPAV